MASLRQAARLTGRRRRGQRRRRRGAHQLAARQQRIGLALAARHAAAAGRRSRSGRSGRRGGRIGGALRAHAGRLDLDARSLLLEAVQAGGGDRRSGHLGGRCRGGRLVGVVGARCCRCRLVGGLGGRIVGGRSGCGRHDRRLGGARSQAAADQPVGRPLQVEAIAAGRGRWRGAAAGDALRLLRDGGGGLLDGVTVVVGVGRCGRGGGGRWASARAHLECGPGSQRAHGRGGNDGGGAGRLVGVNVVVGGVAFGAAGSVVVANVEAIAGWGR